VACAVTKCSVDLLSFEEVRKRLHLSEQLDRGLQQISLEDIRGSVGRYEDFTTTFMPLKEHLRERWEKVDQAVIAGKTPPIEVYLVGEVYFVLDGNHRVSVAREHGHETIDAFVSEFPTPIGDRSKEAIDRHLIALERTSFQEKLGGAGKEAVKEFVFTCPGCYRDLAGQIENYRVGLEKAEEKSVSIERAYSAWYREVYTPAVKAIREFGLLQMFPERTEADLFIWAWENGDVLKELVG
jgi:uncharacterized ParB-like nuclease family protein